MSIFLFFYHNTLYNITKIVYNINKERKTKINQQKTTIYKNIKEGLS